MFIFVSPSITNKTATTAVSASALSEVRAGSTLKQELADTCTNMQGAIANHNASRKLTMYNY